MKAGAERPTGWITKEQLFACLAATGAGGVTEHQLERWRAEGLLPRVHQEPLKGHGSAVRYSPGSCEQIRAIHTLRKKFKKVERIGWELWWQGFQVADECWIPQLEAAVRQLDFGLKTLQKWTRLESGPTASERVAQLPLTNILLSRAQGRLKNDKWTTFLGTLLDVAAGNFVQFQTSGETASIDDEEQAKKAFDIEQSEKDAIFGKKLHLVRALPAILKEISAGLANFDHHSFLQNRAEIQNARDDLRNAHLCVLAMYETQRWIYRERAFGLRFAAWVARKSTPERNAFIVLTWAALRRVSKSLLPSGEIARLAARAEANRQMATKLEELSKQARFARVFNPNRLRRGLRNSDSFSDLLSEVKAAKMRKLD